MKKMTKKEIQNFFPIMIEERQINKKNSDITDKSEPINNIAELEDYIKDLRSGPVVTK